MTISEKVQKVSKALHSEATYLTSKGDHRSVKAIEDFLAGASSECLADFFDLVTDANSKAAA